MRAVTDYQWLTVARRLLMSSSLLVSHHINCILVLVLMQHTQYLSVCQWIEIIAAAAATELHMEGCPMLIA